MMGDFLQRIKVFCLHKLNDVVRLYDFIYLFFMELGFNSVISDEALVFQASRNLQRSW